MREGWSYKKLGEVCHLTMGQSPESESYNKEGNGLPFFQGCSDFGTLYPIVTTYCSSPKKTAEPLDVLISVRAPIGTLNLANDKCCIGRGLASIRAIENVSVYKFLYYFLSNAKTDLQNQGTGATFKSIGKDILTKYPVNLPPLTTQQQIVSELDLLSHILDQKRQQLKEYDALAESIFYDMFGDPMENPKGWEMKKLGELFKVTSSKRILQEEWSDFGVPFLKVADLVSIIDGKKLNPSTFIPEAIFSKLIEDGNVPKEGDILVTSRGTIGHCYIVKSQDRFYFQDGMITWLSNNKGLVIPIYIVKLFQNKEFLDKLTNSTNKSTVSYLSIGQISKKEIPLPPLTLQHSFAAKIESIEHQKQLLRASIKETEMLFQSRMDYWFNG